jgi:hypothetical protein
MIIRFEESLDQALAVRGIQILLGGVLHAGDLSLLENESEVHFFPRLDWQTGEYELSVAADLEDLAGNSLRKPFEVQMDQGNLPMHEESQSRRVTIK